jgi:hypothetical protein
VIYILKYHVMDGIIVEHSRSREGRTKKKVCQLFEEKWNEIPSGKEEKKNNTKLKSENHTCGLMLGVIKLLNEKLVFSNILFFLFLFLLFCFSSWCCCGWKILPEIFHIGNGYSWILHAVIDDRVDGHRHGVSWQDLDNIKKDHANIE